MQQSIFRVLMGFENPNWLFALPLCLLPLLLEKYRNFVTITAQSGWGIAEGSRTDKRRWLLIFSCLCQILGAICLVVGLANPERPVISLLKPRQIGHYWSIVLDSSGSMSEVDSGQTQSRLERLSLGLNEAIEKRPNDLYSIIRVAGFADQLGPMSVSGQFLSEVLAQIKPALPGEDGTSLGDGLALAADALPRDVPRQRTSILMVSDGRDNPPDQKAQTLKDVASLIETLKIRVDWLRVALPERADESPESQSRGKESRDLIERLVRNSGGDVIELDQQKDWGFLADAAMGRIGMIPSAAGTVRPGALFFYLACLVFWLASIVSRMVEFQKNHREAHKYPIHCLMRPEIVLGTLCISVGVGKELLDQTNRAKTRSAIDPESRWLILVDVSPSMAVRDTIAGTRLETAKLIAKRLVERLSLKDRDQAAVIGFSGRAVGLTPWTSDWQSLERTIEQLSFKTIVPTGSDWNKTLEKAFEFCEMAGEEAKPGRTRIIVMTDGESSVPVSIETLESFQSLKIPIDVITLGDHEKPGSVFSVSGEVGDLWMDKRSNSAARSSRNDALPREISQKSGGRLFVIGNSDFEMSQLIDQFLGRSKLWMIKPEDRIRKNSQSLFLAAFLSFSVTGLLRIWWHVRDGRMGKALGVICMVACGISCSESAGPGLGELIHQAALEDYERGDYLRAKARLKEAQEDFPEEPTIPYNLGLIDANTDLPEEALKLFEKAEQLVQSSEEFRSKEGLLLTCRIKAAQGYALMRLGRWEEAEKTLQESVGEDAGTGIETGHAEENLAWVRERLLRSKQRKGVTGEELKVDDQKADLQKNEVIRMEESPEMRLTRITEQARSRARIARERFQTAGDEIMEPARQLELSRRMDW